MTAAKLWTCTTEEYHADHTAVSRSELEVFRRSRRRYFAQYVAKTLPFREPSEAQELGSTSHLAILEPAEFAAKCCVAPKCDRRTVGGKAVWKAFLEETASDAVIVSEADRSRVLAMRDAVNEHPIAAKLLGYDGESETSVRWHDPATGIECKARFDRIARDKNLIIDLKTTKDASPEAFSKACFNFGYHRQAEWYLSGFSAMFGRPASFVFIAVETEPPHTVAVYELAPADIALADRQNYEALTALKDCRESGEWSFAWERQINSLGLPRWAAYDDYQIED